MTIDDLKHHIVLQKKNDNDSHFKATSDAHDCIDLLKTFVDISANKKISIRYLSIFLFRMDIPNINAPQGRVTCYR